jgi:surfactin synthase thioesterase subunit
MSSNTVLVIVPGSFAPVVLYDDFVALLTKNNIESRVVPLASVGRRDSPPPATMFDDVDAIVNVVEGVWAEDKDVVLLCHSYGGVPTTESMKVLSSQNRAAGQRSVKRVIYMTAVVLEPGQNNFALSGGKFPDWLEVQV